MSDIGSTPALSPPAGTVWVGDWDADFQDRVYGGDPVVIGDIAALLTGVQHRNGATVSRVAPSAFAMRAGAIDYLPPTGLSNAHIFSSTTASLIVVM